MIGNDDLLLMDAHVHIYGCFQLAPFFDSAFSNFRNAAAGFGRSEGYMSILFMTEGKNERRFDRLMHAEDAGSISEQRNLSHFKIKKTLESFSLSVCRDGSPPMFLIAGRQIVAKEKLEVLALISSVEIPDGLSLQATVESILDNGGIPVVPWGFGKWVGRRGRVLDSFLSQELGRRVFLGDNSGRPSLLPLPAQFRSGSGNGDRILPGSDPLPFPSECCKPGSFGCAVHGSLDPARPGEDIRKIILNPFTRFSPYGRLECTSRFLRNQLLMQFRKWKKPPLRSSS